MAEKKRIIVVGSINMDLVARTPRIPLPGETLMGDSFVTVPGGKGANQAVAAARLGAKTCQVHLVGRVGGDDFGERMLNGFNGHGVETGRVTVTEGASSGVAIIFVDRQGENTIVVAPGANALLTPRDVDAAEDLIAGAAAVILQLEIPLETAVHVVAMCQRLGVFTILDPTPAPENLPRELYGVDIFTPNQREATALLGVSAPGRGKHADDAKGIGAQFLSLGARTVVLKRGNRGAVVIDRDETIRTIPPYKVNVVDTTAAGDAFTGALAVGRAEGMALAESVRFANAAGALCCQAFGAQPALPSREAVDQLIAETPKDRA